MIQRKSILFLLSVLFLFFSCSSPKEKNPNLPENAIDPAVVENPASATGDAKGNVPTFKFLNTTHDFGKIVDGEKVSFAFRFTNSGTGDLLIRAANGSCGCTVPEYPKEPIPPGGSGIITVTFNSEGRVGMQNKTVSLIANTIPNTTELSISAEVLEAK